MCSLIYCSPRRVAQTALITSPLASLTFCESARCKNSRLIDSDARPSPRYFSSRLRKQGRLATQEVGKNQRSASRKSRGAWIRVGRFRLICRLFPRGNEPRAVGVDDDAQRSVISSSSRYTPFIHYAECPY